MYKIAFGKLVFVYEKNTFSLSSRKTEKAHQIVQIFFSNCAFPQILERLKGQSTEIFYYLFDYMIYPCPDRYAKKAISNFRRVIRI
jgi:hypothetical protein